MLLEQVQLVLLTFIFKKSSGELLTVMGGGRWPLIPKLPLQFCPPSDKPAKILTMKTNGYQRRNNSGQISPAVSWGLLGELQDPKRHQIPNNANNNIGKGKNFQSAGIPI